MKKKLIEVALPLEEINKEAAREKSIRHGHPSTLHLWWARRPLAACRAVLFSSLVDDPESDDERERLFEIIRKLVKWENINDEALYKEALAEIKKSCHGKNLPPILDPFAGGGSIPLEAQRLGLEAHASDLNPVAVLINKALIEIPPRFANFPPVNPESHRMGGDWHGASGLAEDVRYYGELMKKRALEKIGHLYPKAKLSNGKEATVIAWLWARTVKCPNPACGAQMLLISSYWLSKKKGKEAWLEPVIDKINKTVNFEVKTGTGKPQDPPKLSRGASFRCLCCGETAPQKDTRAEFVAKRDSSTMLAIVAEGANGREYIAPTDDHVEVAHGAVPKWKPSEEMNQDTSNLVSGRGYGITHWHEIFTPRQLTALTTFSDIIAEIMAEVERDALAAGIANDKTGLDAGGSGAKAYSEAVGVYLACVLDKLIDYNSSICSWNIGRDGLRSTFARQAIPMIWDYVETNPFSDSSGCWDNALEWIYKCLANFTPNAPGYVSQRDAAHIAKLSPIVISTDPPYYDNIGYADLSDFFYIWLRRSLSAVYPSLFSTMLVPKAEELVATPYRFDGSTEKARDFFENGMLKAFSSMRKTASPDYPMTVYYAFKQTESEEDDEGEQAEASTGWEAMLQALIKAGFAITGTWPLRTERPGRTLSIGTNALASSIALVCRPRDKNAPTTSRRDFINALKRELKPALAKLQASNIAPVDLAQSAIGPGIGVYSQFSNVIEADGTPMSVRSALQIINQELDLYFTGQDGELDSDSRFCVDLYSQYAFNDVKFGDANVLAQAKNTSIEKLTSHGVLYAQKGLVRLLAREEIPKKVNPSESIIWLLTQQLTHAMETGGVQATAEIVVNMLGSNAEQAKALAYRLFTIADKKGNSAEAFAYNSLVVSSQDVQSRAAELQSQEDRHKQKGMFEDEEDK